MPARDEPPNEELEHRLDELEAVLDELRSELKRSERVDRGQWAPPRPPRLSELFRFTEQYTIPTLIAVLETTIRSLELVRGTLRLMDPDHGLGGAADGSADRFADVRDEASAGLARSLSELRTVLAGTELPADTTSRDLITDARDLTAEIESRLTEARADVTASRKSGYDNGTDRDRQKSGPHSSGAIHIDVQDPDDPASSPDRIRDDNSKESAERVNAETDAGPDTDDADRPVDSADEPAPTVDVDAELQSIKRQLDALDAESAKTHNCDDSDIGGSDNDADVDVTDDTDDADDGHSGDDTDDSDDGDSSNVHSSEESSS